MMRNARAARTARGGLALLLGLALVASDCAAQARRADGGDQALKRAQFMLRALTQEKAELEAKVAALEAAQKKTDTELEAQKAANEALVKRLEQFNEANSQLLARIQTDASKYQSLAREYAAALAAIKRANVDNALLVNAIEEREAFIARVRERNEALVGTNKDLLAAYEKEGFDSTDSILGLARVDIENTVQDFRFRIEDLQSEPFKASQDVSASIRAPDQGLPPRERARTSADGAARE